MFIKFELDTETFFCDLFLLWSKILNVIMKQNEGAEHKQRLDNLSVLRKENVKVLGKKNNRPHKD
ncbi:hypothetical protein DU64_16575 [Methanosarcina mazei]|uniref:Uncharacterized protein n=1 Tax=Methanosarcina mazei TaxID=2209 RepID=A0A0F8IBG2_METMZ|nr:hypothetical protein DU33_07100 [Methanosarcina mazei]KKG60893.1 hypothetical protein DU45_16300 [Methanosarcina mazei]KKG64020.1 hypothetical protein DU64_16575 [Methanosarcina mazei]